MAKVKLGLVCWMRRNMHGLRMKKPSRRSQLRWLWMVMSLGMRTLMQMLLRCEACNMLIVQVARPTTTDRPGIG
eukprot:6300631-Amphidinium_carterae.1